MLPTPSPTVVFQKLEDGAVLFAPETELYFGLNEVGALLWTLLSPPGRTLDALCEAVHARYPDVEASVIRVDVVELLEQLGREGLVRPAPPGTVDGASRS